MLVSVLRITIKQDEHVQFDVQLPCIHMLRVLFIVLKTEDAMCLKTKIRTEYRLSILVPSPNPLPYHT